VKADTLIGEKSASGFLFIAG
jgi:hypothetical protein